MKQGRTVGLAMALAAGLLAAASARAGGMDSPGATNSAASAMWTLNDVYSVLDTRATNVAKRTTGFNNPTNGPTTNGTMRSLNDIMLLVTNRAPVPKTGQTTGFATRDDGALKMGVASPSTRFTVVGASGDETNQVRDNLTGLIWARDAKIFSASTWGVGVTNCNTLTYGGTNDWRLPNIRELNSLVSYDKYGPCIPSGHPFRNVSGTFWVSTQYNSNTAYGWSLSMDSGQATSFDKSGAYYIWPVRGGGR